MCHNIEGKRISKFAIFCWVLVIVTISLMVFAEIRGEIKKLERKQIYALAQEKYARKRAIEQACRDRWAGKSKVPVKGGGWVDMRKIPYDFLYIHQDDDGECRATGIAGENYFYWDGDGDKVIPKHPAFSGQYRPIERSGMSEGSQGYTFIQYYPKESWKIFRMSFRFYNQEKISECEARGNSYTFDRRGECREKCQEDDGTYIIDDRGKCVINIRIKEPFIPPSRIVPSISHPDLDLRLKKCLSSCIVLRPENDLYFWVKNWPHEPLAPLLVDSGVESALWHRTLEEWGKIDLGEKKFKMDTTNMEGIVFPGGRINYSGGKIKLNEAPVFLRILHAYVSELFIKEN